jgi:hypothetical protein
VANFKLATSAYFTRCGCANYRQQNQPMLSIESRDQIIESLISLQNPDFLFAAFCLFFSSFCWVAIRRKRSWTTSSSTPNRKPKNVCGNGGTRVELSATLNVIIKRTMLKTMRAVIGFRAATSVRKASRYFA